MSGITRHGKRVRFYSTVDLVNALEQEKAHGKAGRIALSLLRIDLVILDLCVADSNVELAPDAARAHTIRQSQLHITYGLKVVVTN